MVMAPVGHSGRQAPSPSQYESENQFGLSVHHGQSAFVAGAHANPAAVALFFVNRDDVADHSVSSYECQVSPLL
jgi:hypothetical protein